MIEVVLNVLLRSKLISSEEDVKYNVSFGKNVVFQIRDEVKQRTLIAKASSSESIMREHHALETIEPHLISRVPKLLAFEEHQGTYVLVMEGVSHKRLTSALIETNYHKVSIGLREVLQFGLSSEMRRGSALEEFSDRLSTLPHTEARQRIVKYVESMDSSVIENLPTIPQHCDFAFTNLGIRRDTRTLIVFDWEDYGRVDFPGFDVAILITSFFDFDSERIFRFFAGGETTAFGRLIDECLITCKIGHENFRTLYPVYLCLFLELKASLEYDDSTVERISKTLVKYCELVDMKAQSH